MGETSAANTAGNSSRKAPGRPFVKGDPRINRRGRPRSFAALRQLALAIAREAARDKRGRPIIHDQHTVSQVERILRQMVERDPARFLEIAYGRVPQAVEVSGPGSGPIPIQAVDYAAAVAAITPGSGGDRPTSGEAEMDRSGATLGQDDDGG